jgi:hypothetical protein
MKRLLLSLIALCALHTANATTFDCSQANGTTLEVIDSKWEGNSTLINCQGNVMQVTATGGGTPRVARYENGQGSIQSAQMDCAAGGAGTRRGVGTQNHATQVGYQTRFSGTNAVELRRNGTYVAEGAISGGNHTTTGYTIKITSNASTGRVQVWWAALGAADAEATGTMIIDNTDGSPLSTGYPSMEVMATTLTTDASADNWTDFQSTASGLMLKRRRH